MNLNYAQLASKMTLDQRSKDLRLLVLEALEGGSRGHLGPALSLIEIVRVLYDSVLYHDSNNPFLAQRDRFILSKGHGCLGLYAVLADHGYISKSELKGFCSFQSNLGGHPERLTLPGIEFSTGSLGHGFSVGVGMAIASRLKGEHWRTFVLIGDGELGEGSNWEAAMHASQHRLGSLTVIIDFNQMQAYGQINSILTLDPLAAKFEAFGFNVVNVNGHDITQLEKELNSPTSAYGKPKAIIAYTVKGKGIPSAENSTIWHHKAKIKSEEIAPLRLELTK
jgi:transketolase